VFTTPLIPVRTEIHHLQFLDKLCWAVLGGQLAARMAYLDAAMHGTRLARSVLGQEKLVAGIGA